MGRGASSRQNRDGTDSRGSFGLEPAAFRDPQGRLHRQDGPALVIPAGVIYSEAFPTVLRSITGPATIYAVSGQLHRIEGPAITWPDGVEEWFFEGCRHAENRPAVVVPQGGTWIDDGGRERPGPAQIWFRQGLHHRVGGPAIAFAEGSEIWMEEGVRHRPGGQPAEKTSEGTGWYVRGRLHRVDGPAWIRADGTCEWWQDGKLHREDGPSIEGPNGEPLAWTVRGVSQLPPQ